MCLCANRNAAWRVNESVAFQCLHPSNEIVAIILLGAWSANCAPLCLEKCSVHSVHLQTNASTPRRWWRKFKAEGSQKFPESPNECCLQGWTEEEGGVRFVHLLTSQADVVVPTFFSWDSTLCHSLCLSGEHKSHERNVHKRSSSWLLLSDWASTLFYGTLTFLLLCFGLWKWKKIQPLPLNF